LSSRKSSTPGGADGGADAGADTGVDGMPTDRLRPLPAGDPGAMAAAGRRLSHYELKERIGGGGMGVIYRAVDTRLERVVAVKFLAQRFTGDDAAKQRFLQEARAASAIDHPNICTIYEIDETDDGELYLVMAHYEGQTLSARLRERGPLPLVESVDVLRQILNGLARAHEAGIVHRDVKPGNLMLTPYDEVKILDFGLAKLTHGPLQLTQTGFVHGTAAYMAPEQAKGQKADHRADIWSAGVVLFEMLAGRHPFRGEHPAAILYAVVHDEPEPLSGLRDDVPPEVEDVVATALQKDPAFRYQTVRDMLGALEGPPPSFSSPPTLAFPRPGKPAPMRSILVLPFANVSPDAELEYFSDGLTDEVITDLSAIGSLRVISRTSAMQLKGTAKDIRTIGRELSVQYVLEGAVRIRDDSLRLTAKLVDAGRDVNIWAEKFSGRLDDVLEIQEQLSRQIVAALKIRLSPQEEEKLAERPIADARAFECFLRAKQEVLRYSEEGLDRAFTLLDEAQEIVGDNPLLLAARSYALWQYVNAGVTGDRSLLETARNHAERILEIEPDSPHGHRLLGIMEVAAGHPQEAVRHLKRALAKDANDTDTLAWLVGTYALVGRPTAAVPIADRLLRIDPLTPFHHGLYGFLWVLGGDLSRGLVSIEKAYRMEPGNPLVQLLYGQSLAMAGRTEPGLEQLDALAEAAGASLFGQIGRCLAAALRGDEAAMRSAISDEAEASIRADGEWSWMAAQSFALVGRRDEALDWLRSAVDHGFINHPMLARDDPFLAGLRGTPAFQQLLAEVEDRWNAFET
jgi:eukaryotic-like serine/threonine-protein kinase